MKIKILILALFVSLGANAQGLKALLMSQTETVDLTDGLEFVYELNETSGSTAYDAHTTSNDGVFESSNGNLTLGVTGKLSYGTSVDGQDDGIISPYDIATVTDYSVSLWIKGNAPGITNIRFLFSFFSNSEGLRIVEDVSTGKNAIDYRIFTGSFYTYVCSGNLFDEDTWTHIVVTRHGSESQGFLKLYVNGTLVDSYTGSAVGTDIYYGQLYTGGGQLYSDAEYVGVYDQIAFWKRAINSAEVSALYNSNSGLTYTNW